MRPVLPFLSMLVLTACFSPTETGIEEPAEIGGLNDRFSEVLLEKAPETVSEATTAAPVVESERVVEVAAAPSDLELALKGETRFEGLGLDGSTGGLVGGMGTSGSGMAGGGGSYGGGGSFGSLGSKGVGAGASGRGGGSSEMVIMRGESTASTSRPAAPLKAGSTDDNDGFGAYLSFLSDERGHGRLGRVDSFAVADRTFIRVLDLEGEPVPSASVRVLNDGQEVWRGETYGDGRVPYYPGQFGSTVTRVEVSHLGQSTSESWRAEDELTLRVDVSAIETVRMDVALILDTTGSMSDELSAIKRSIRDVTERLREDGKQVDLRFGAVLYRDHGDIYLTQTTKFGDLESFEAMLSGVEAGGGGDTPEALHEALYVAVTDLDWREDVARVAFLVADAPPHLENGRGHGQSSGLALSEGIRIHTVAASGLDRMGTLVFRRIAQLTRGKFIFIEYGGDMAGTAASHGVSGQVESNNLGTILYRELKAEMDGWGQWTM